LSGKTMSKVTKAIQGNKQITFFYKGRTSHDVTAEPYRIAYFDGVWYLVARDTNDQIIKKYILQNMQDIRILRSSSHGMPDDLDETLERSVNIWFSGERNMEVLIEVDAAWAHYFKKRSILPLQEIAETREDGSVLVRFFACSIEEIMMCLKPWLPHVRVLKPTDIKDLLVKEYRQWIGWQDYPDD
ncbi:MAG TPA: WYL domain-containing protein, partial [Deltaproteobacteria bacterium]|nr:WYL domain-containing protein [Deltaproteobacteria bacterium]